MWEQGSLVSLWVFSFLVCLFVLMERELGAKIADGKDPGGRQSVILVDREGDDSFWGTILENLGGDWDVRSLHTREFLSDYSPSSLSASLVRCTSLWI